MKIPVNLTQNSFLPIESFEQHLDKESRFLMSAHAISKEQVVPFLYLVNSPHIEINGLNSVSDRKVVFQPGGDEGFASTISLKGIALLLVSSEKKVLLAFEQFEDLFSSNYDFRNSYYNIFHVVDRADIVQYEKTGDVKFHAVNAKTSDTLQRNSRVAARGIIASALLKGVTSLTGKMERDLKVSDGVKYKLSFRLNNELTAIELVAEKEYEQNFDIYLSKHWTNAEPQIEAGPQKKGGCYIATACYRSYDHPSVMVLRNFRDEVLLKNTAGKLFVRVYYRYSPFWANHLKKSTIINSVVRRLFLDPLVCLLSGRSKK